MNQINENLHIFNNHKIIPVITINDVDKALKVVKVLLDSGISILEVTLRTPNALNIIETIRTKIPEIIIGAGTILNETQYHLAIKHLAQFTVSPGLTNELINVSQNYDIPFIPGVITPSEVIYASQAGFNTLKFFPATAFNGLNILKNYHQIFKNINFCPTGGINESIAKEYLNLPNVISIGCSFIVSNELIEREDYATITHHIQKLHQMLLH